MPAVDCAARMAGIRPRVRRTIAVNDMGSHAAGFKSQRREVEVNQNDFGSFFDDYWRAANLTWGDKDYRTLYIRATTSVYRLRTRIREFVPYLAH